MKSTTSEPSELPRWKCHKEVMGFKIALVEKVPDPEILGFKVYLTDQDRKYNVLVTGEYLKRHSRDREGATLVGGYYVRYEDGYESWSPAKAFEDGYSPMGQVDPAAPGIAEITQESSDQSSAAVIAEKGTVREAPEMQPTIGRIVRYVMDPSDVEDVHCGDIGDVVPAIVVGRWPNPEGNKFSGVNLQVFLNGPAGVYYVQCVDQDEMCSPGTWHWPPRGGK